MQTEKTHEKKLHYMAAWNHNNARIRYYKKKGMDESRLLELSMSSYYFEYVFLLLSHAQKDVI